MYKNELEAAKKIAILAGKKIIEIYNGNFDVEYKLDESPVTSADLIADTMIVDYLKNLFPSYSILSEESSDDLSRLKNKYCWIVDPLDGTKEFINRTDEFTVNIALAVNGKVVLGVIYVPVSEEIYYASIESGSYYQFNDKIIKNKVSSRREKLRILSSKYHKSESFLELIENNARVISSIEGVGSSLKGCLISRGLAEVYYRFGYTGEWDTAAMQIIVEEAGGVFKQLDDSNMRYNREDTLNRKGFYVLNNNVNKLENIRG